MQNILPPLLTEKQLDIIESVLNEEVLSILARLAGKTFNPRVVKRAAVKSAAGITQKIEDAVKVNRTVAKLRKIK